MLTRFLVPLGCILFLSSSPPPLRTSTPEPRPKSVIFLIADGAGPAQFTAAKIIRGAKFQTGRLPFTGLVSTSPVEDSMVTDSAAAATAYATGFRTKYRYVGVDAAGRSRTTALEIAEKDGKSTGLVTTANFFDATPAAFAAHTPSRYESELIIRQMLSSGAEVIIGGGLAHFGRWGRPTIEQVASLSRYELSRTLTHLQSSSGDRILGVFATEKHEVDFPEARLPSLARVAIERLARNPKGFFLMIEQEGTDGAAHNNATDAFLASLVSFDETVGVALDFAATNTDVLILVTGDHETGGLQIHAEKSKDLQLRWGTTGHTGEAIPIFAMGPGADQFVGFLDGEEVGQRLLKLLQPQTRR